MSTPLTAEYLIEVAREIISKTPYCFLITLGEAGRPNARLMDHFGPEDDLTLWLGTSIASRKVQHILHHNKVTVADADPDDYAYVTLSGEAQIVKDVALQRRYWREAARSSFPGGPESDEYVLIKFTPLRIEIMSYAHRVAPSHYGFRPAILVRLGDTWLIEERGIDP